MKNIYYSPEAYGLEVVASFELREESWEFDMLVVWRDPETGHLYYAEDSGCSCPCPFEDHDRQTVTPAQSVTEIISRLEYRIREGYDYRYDPIGYENRLMDMRRELLNLEAVGV